MHTFQNEEMIKSLKSDIEKIKKDYERKLVDQRIDLCDKYSEMMENMRTMYRYVYRNKIIIYDLFEK